jgi:hypothetical protein
MEWGSTPPPPPFFLIDLKGIIFADSSVYRLLRIVLRPRATSISFRLLL